MSAVHHLEVILKTSSRCNINCSYCYYFYGSDDSWKNRPKRISTETLNQLISFLTNAILQQGIRSLQIDFHGGEPLLQGKQAFDEACLLFKQSLGSITQLTFALQTNATLVDEEWIELFDKHEVSVSVSLDGPKRVNDAFRLDHKGHSTFEKTKNGIRRLKHAENQKKIGPVNLLSVINPFANGSDVYRYFVDELKICSMDFLLPAKDYHDFKTIEVRQVGHFLLDVWREWVKDDNPKIRVRFFEAFFASLSGQKSFLYPSEHYGETGRVAMTVETDGQIFGDDSLRSNEAWKQYPFLHLETCSFSEFIQAEQGWYQIHAKVPHDCGSCLWVNVCKGGQLEHRFTVEQHYNNVSSYCHALQLIYSEILEYLYEHGLNKEQIYQVLAA